MFEGENVILRQFTAEDVDEYLAIRSVYSERGEQDDVGFRSAPQFRQSFNETGFIEEHLERWVIADKKGKMLGMIMFFKEPSYQSGYEVGFGIHKRADRNKGIMTEALRIFSAYLFELKDISRISLGTDVDNIPAIRVAEKAGYKQEGTLRKFYFSHGEHKDCVVYSLLREECPRLSEVLVK